jgi:hypothetical protein
LDLELEAFQKKARTLTREELDRDLTELFFEIDFLQRQMQADLRSYSSKELESIYERIARHKQKLRILEIELAKRGPV